MRILGSSREVRKSVSKLMSSGTRRVAITAFIGEGANAFIRKPKGVEIVCWPKAGGTNPLELRRLKKAGARIRFADRLHMKIYWAFNRGVVITSANLSTNALGAGDLKEFGVLLPSTAVAIDEVIQSLKARPFNRHEMERLEYEHRKLATGRQRSYQKIERISYSEWFDLPARPEWKLGWWDTTGSVARRAQEIAKVDFNQRSPHTFISCRRNDYREADWVLSFRLTAKGASAPEWVYVDFMVKVSRGEKDAYFDDYPYQAVQVTTRRHYPSPPFAITKGFRAALREASVSFGIDRLKNLRSVDAPRDFLRMIRRKLNSDY
jgi:hypothetical protein